MLTWGVYLLGRWVFDVKGKSRKVAMDNALQYLGLKHPDGVDVQPISVQEAA